MVTFAKEKESFRDSEGKEILTSKGSGGMYWLDTLDTCTKLTAMIAAPINTLVDLDK